MQSQVREVKRVLSRQIKLANAGNFVTPTGSVSYISVRVKNVEKVLCLNPGGSCHFSQKLCTMASAAMLLTYTWDVRGSKTNRAIYISLVFTVNLSNSSNKLERCRLYFFHELFLPHTFIFLLFFFFFFH